MNGKAAMSDNVRLRQGWFMATIAIWVLSFSSPAWSETQPWLEFDKPPAQAREVLTEYLSVKYRGSSADVRVVPDGQDVAWRWVSMFGDFTPSGTVTPEPGEHGKPRAMARAFLQEEAAPLFGIRPADIHADKVSKGRPEHVTQTSIRHQIHVGDLPLEGAWVTIGFDSHDRIVNVSARLVPITEAMRQAARHPTIGEQQIRRFVQADIETDAKSEDAPYPVRRYPADPYKRPTDVEKFVIPTPPYVVWHVQSIWRYYIDAFTGEILSKTPGWADAK